MLLHVTSQIVLPVENLATYFAGDPPTFLMRRHVSVQFRQAPKTLFAHNATKVCVMCRINVLFQSSAGAEMFIAMDAICPATVLLMLIFPFFLCERFFAFSTKKRSRRSGSTRSIWIIRFSQNDSRSSQNICVASGHFHLRIRTLLSSLWLITDWQHWKQCFCLPTDVNLVRHSIFPRFSGNIPFTSFRGSFSFIKKWGL